MSEGQVRGEVGTMRKKGANRPRSAPDSQQVVQQVRYESVRRSDGHRRRKRTSLPPRRGWRLVVVEYVLLLLGAALIALGFNLFLSPNQVASGGIAGISILVHHLTGIEPAWVQWSLSLPLLALGMWRLGGRFGAKAIVGAIMLPLLVLLTRHLPSLTTNLLLACIYGGMLVGAGLGLVFRGRGSTGGLDIAAQLLQRATGLSPGWSIAILDGLVIVSAGLVLSAEKALYALIGLYVTGKTIQVVQLGLSVSKVAYIITERVEAMREAVLFELDRGVTLLHATGGYTGEPRTVLMVVVSQTELAALKELVRQHDPSAFVILGDTHEVLGEGFRYHG